MATGAVAAATATLDTALAAAAAVRRCGAGREVSGLLHAAARSAKAALVLLQEVQPQPTCPSVPVSTQRCRPSRVRRRGMASQASSVASADTASQSAPDAAPADSDGGLVDPTAVPARPGESQLDANREPEQAVVDGAQQRVSDLPKEMVVLRQQLVDVRLASDHRESEHCNSQQEFSESFAGTNADIGSLQELLSTQPSLEADADLEKQMHNKDTVEVADPGSAATDVLAGKDWQVRSTAAKVPGGVGERGTAAVPEFASARREPEHSKSQRGPERSKFQQECVAGLDSAATDLGHREAAAKELLGDFGEHSTAAVTELVQPLEDEGGYLRLATMTLGGLGLGELGTAAVPVLAKLIADSESGDPDKIQCLFSFMKVLRATPRGSAM